MPCRRHRDAASEGEQGRRHGELERRGQPLDDERETGCTWRSDRPKSPCSARATKSRVLDVERLVQPEHLG